MRSAVQKQLEGVQKGLRGMKEAEKAVKEIKVSMGEVEQLYQECSELSEVVRPIKEVNKRHQQVIIMLTRQKKVHYMYIIKLLYNMGEQGDEAGEFPLITILL